MAISVVRKRRGAGPFPAGTQGQRLHYLHYGLSRFRAGQLLCLPTRISAQAGGRVAEENSGNFGLLDLAAALDWARQQKRPVLRVGGRAISSGRDHLSEYLGP